MGGFANVDFDRLAGLPFREDRAVQRALARTAGAS